MQIVALIYIRKRAGVGQSVLILVNYDLLFSRDVIIGWLVPFTAGQPRGTSVLLFHVFLSHANHNGILNIFCCCTVGNGLSYFTALTCIHF